MAQALSATKPIVVQKKKHRRPVYDRFWSKVAKAGPDECWLWTACLLHDGYGHFGIRKGVFARAHRLAYELSVGPIPDGLSVLHNCPAGDNPRCCNPAHLFLGTQADNMNDCVRKGRHDPSRGEANVLAKLTDEKVARIRRRHAAGGISLRGLAREFDISLTVVGNVVHRRSWRHVAV